MADVFLSYKAEDRPRVHRLADTLEADGLSLWWDARIEAGEEWRQAIQEQLDQARCVIVVWSRASTGPDGRFVRDEATRAQRRGVYLPVCIDPVDLPLGFGELQALPLLDWSGDRGDPRYGALLSAVRAMIEGRPPTRGLTPGLRAPRFFHRRSMVIGGSALAVIAAGVGGLLRHKGAIVETDSIAVLPFANLSGDPAQAYFSDGIAEELRTALSRIADLKVAARTSSERFRRSADVTTAASELGVANILLGSVRRYLGTVRISAQLVDGVSGIQHWAQSFDRPTGDELAIQSEIAESVAGSLRIRFGRAERAALQLGGTRIAAAQDALLRGRAIDGNTVAHLYQKLAAYDAAIAADPRFATAYGARAIVLTAIAGFLAGPDRIASVMAAEAAAARAVALAPALPYAQTAFARAKESQLDFAGADRAYRLARGLPGNDSRALTYNALFLSATGRTGAALPLIDQAIALDPLDPKFLVNKGEILLDARRYDDALVTTRRAIALGARDDEARGMLGMALVLLGRQREALVAIAPIEDEVVRRVVEVAATTGLGNHPASDRALSALLKLDDGSIDVEIALAHAQRGEADLALAALKRAEAGRTPGLVELPSSPFLDPLRKDPRFQALLLRLDFPLARPA